MDDEVLKLLVEPAAAPLVPDGLAFLDFTWDYFEYKLPDVGALAWWILFCATDIRCNILSNSFGYFCWLERIPPFFEEADLLDLLKKN